MLSPNETAVYFLKIDPVEFSQHFYAILFYQQKKGPRFIQVHVLSCKLKLWLILCLVSRCTFSAVSAHTVIAESF